MNEYVHILAVEMESLKAESSSTLLTETSAVSSECRGLDSDETCCKCICIDGATSNHPLATATASVAAEAECCEMSAADNGVSEPSVAQCHDKTTSSSSSSCSFTIQVRQTANLHYTVTYQYSFILCYVYVSNGIGSGLTLPYLTLAWGWAGCYTSPVLRPYQFGPMRNPDVTRRSQ